MINKVFICFILIYVAAWGAAAITEKATDAPQVPETNIPVADFDLIQDRMSCLDTDIPMHFNETVKSFVDYFCIKKREYIPKVAGKTSIYFPLFEKKLAEYGLPDELKYLAIVESALNTQAVSRVGAVGLWQFMPATGRLYGLKQNWFLDERRDPEQATEAACKYLKELHGIFDDWELALAAYNAGPGNVRRAIRRSGKRKFWELYRYLPRETRSYVPQFVAITYTMNYLQEHNFSNKIFYEYLMETDTVHLHKPISLKVLGEQLNVCEQDLRLINPQLRHAITPEGNQRFALNLPSDMVDYFRGYRAEIMDSATKAANKDISYITRNQVGSTYGRDRIVYRVRPGDVLGRIAGRHGVRVSDIRSWNRIRGNLIKPNQRLVLWVKPSYSQPKTAVAKKTNHTPQRPVIPNGNMHLVEPGDSLWSIARKYENVTVDKIKKLNKLKSNRIKPGQKLIIG